MTIDHAADQQPREDNENNADCTATRQGGLIACVRSM